MTNQERRDVHLAYIADEPVFKELVRAKALVQKLNAVDRTDEDGIRKLVQELMGTEQIPYIVPPSTATMGTISALAKMYFLITTAPCWMLGRSPLVTTVCWRPT